jgi:cathepsin L
MILDCTLGKGNDGCEGGGFTPTFDFLQKSGQVTEAQYPYTETSSDDGWNDNECRQFSNAYKITGWWQVPARDEEALKRYVAFYGPASVAIHVNSAVMSYKRGIFDSKCNGGRNHAVLVVGYGSEGGKDFWVVKNSWSTNYGENGYIRMKRGNGNICDIAGDAVVINA